MTAFKIILLFLVLINLAICMGVPQFRGNPVPAKKFIIDLDLPPRERWVKIVKLHEKVIKDMILLAKLGGLENLMETMSLLVEDIPDPYREEIKGIAENLEDVSPGEILAANLLYEITSDMCSYKAPSIPSHFMTGCTSIVAEAFDGTIFHARNLDFAPTSILQDLTIIVDFQRNGKVLYTGTTFAGYVGLATGQKPYKYTISLNRRHSLLKKKMDNLLGSLVGTNGVIPFIIRDVLDREDMDFAEAAAYMKTHLLYTSCYIIMGGVKPGEGVVITRSATASLDEWRMSASNGTWYVMETNYDRWTSPPAFDRRRSTARMGMELLTRANVGSKGLYEVLSMFPVFNFGTVYTTTMSAAHPEQYNTWIRYLV